MVIQIRGEAGIVYQGKRVSVGIVGCYEYWNYFSGIENPTVNITPGVPVRLVNDNTSLYSVRFHVLTPF